LDQLLLKALEYQVRAVIQAQGLCLTAIQYSQVQIAPQVYTCLCLSSQTLNMHKHLRAFFLESVHTCAQIHTSKGDALQELRDCSDGSHPRDPDCEPRAAMWEQYSGQDQAISRQNQEARSGTSLYIVTC
jgi:hypothetical protein